MKDVIVSLVQADIGEHGVAGPKGVVSECDGEVPRAGIWRPQEGRADIWRPLGAEADI